MDWDKELTNQFIFNNEKDLFFTDTEKETADSVAIIIYTVSSCSGCGQTKRLINFLIKWQRLLVGSLLWQASELWTIQGAAVGETFLVSFLVYCARIIS